MKTAILVFLLTAASALATGEDMSLEARLGDWTISADTAGWPDSNRVVTRVFARRADSKFEAQMELPFDAIYILTDHLSKLPKQRFTFGHVKLPKKDYVNVSEAHEDVFTSPESLALFRLWLDDHRSSWSAPGSPSLQEALRTHLFPPPK